MTSQLPAEIFQQLKQFGADEPAIKAVIVVGSFARGTAGPDSDVDLVIITTDVQRFLNERTWIEKFGKIRSCELEDYKLVQSLRVVYKDGPEMEFGITSMEWIADAQRQSSGEILSGGYRVIYDPDNLVDAFYRKVD